MKISLLNERLPLSFGVCGLMAILGGESRGKGQAVPKGRIAEARVSETVEVPALSNRGMELGENTLRWLEGSLKDARQHGQRLHEELAQLRLHMESVLAEHRAFREAADRRSSELVQIVGSLDAELARSRLQAEELERELTRWRAERENLQNELISAKNRPADSDGELASARQHAHRLEAELNQNRVHLADLQGRLDMVYRSRSWRITWPMRTAHDLLRSGRRGIAAMGRWVAGAMKSVAKRFILAAVRWTQAHPRALGVAKKLLARFPNLDGRIRALVRQQYQPPPIAYPELPIAAELSEPGQQKREPSIDWTRYPASVRRIYRDLRQMIERGAA
jgi:hypothetical protein